MSAPATCPVCSGNRWVPLPDPAPQSMASDWRIVAEALGKHACAACGLIARAPSPEVSPGIFAAGYVLYAHAPGELREGARQAQYAAWIAGSTPVPSRVLDVGCGNGSLLAALHEHWPNAELLGCDPSPESVTRGAAAGLNVWQGTAGDLPPDLRVDLVVSVNVIEHTTDPAVFVGHLRRAVTPGGMLVLICPDGGRPNVEILFADHLFSFGGPHLVSLLARTDFEVRAITAAPHALGEFQMVIARPGAPVADATPRVDVAAIVGRRRKWLERWQALDARLTDRLEAPVVCFGAGEATGLLRAYAPRAWSKVEACTEDVVSAPAFGDVPMIPLDQVPPHGTLLVGVRPADQREIAERLRTRVRRTVTWYDLVEAEHDE